MLDQQKAQGIAIEFLERNRHRIEFLCNKFQSKIGMPLLNRALNPVWSYDQMARAILLQIAETQQEEAEESARLSAIATEEGEYYCSPEFREEVIDALIEEGNCTRAQAEGRTRDQFHLFIEATRLNLM